MVTDCESHNFSEYHFIPLYYSKLYSLEWVQIVLKFYFCEWTSSKTLALKFFQSLIVLFRSEYLPTSIPLLPDLYFATVISSPVQSRLFYFIPIPCQCFWPAIALKKTCSPSFSFYICSIFQHSSFTFSLPCPRRFYLSAHLCSFNNDFI